MTGSLAAALAGIVGDAHVLADEDLTRPFEADWSGRFSGWAAAVVRPADTDQVARVMRACADHGAQVVPQGGNTGLVGGGVPRNGEVVVSTTRLTSLGDVDRATAQVTAGAGVTISHLHAHAAAAGLGYGVDLASRDSATVGGTIATNAGGVNVVRYGSTRAQVIGVEVVLANGQVLRRLDGLAKDSTGYDLPGLMTGSEGTLGIITAARLRLVPALSHRVVALLGVASTAAALDVLAAVRHLASLQAIEWFHRRTLDIVRDHAGLPDPLRATYPTYVVVECAAAADPSEELAAALEHCAAVGDIAVATDRAARERLWSYRERAAEALSAAGIPLKYDVGVPPDRLVEFERRAFDLCAAEGGQLFVFGHLAEGNAHANVLGVDPDDEALDDALLRLVAQLGGSISAEHGIGVAKRPWLGLTRDETDMAAMAAVKAALDPADLLNPGVLLPPRGEPAS
ncbi:MAG: FAD-binding protein [Nitriliruptorales bacterium]|nr:FAD-binding protein [Nitriliruptorales bacterium]